MFEKLQEMCLAFFIMCNFFGGSCCEKAVESARIVASHAPIGTAGQTGAGTRTLEQLWQVFFAISGACMQLPPAAHATGIVCWRETFLLFGRAHFGIICRLDSEEKVVIYTGVF